VQVARIKNSKTIRYSRVLGANDPVYFAIQKDKVVRIREEDYFKKNIISFRILDKNIDSYLPEILNKFSKNLYQAKVFKRVINSCKVDFWKNECFMDILIVYPVGWCYFTK